MTSSVAATRDLAVHVPSHDRAIELANRLRKPNALCIALLDHEWDDMRFLRWLLDQYPDVFHYWMDNEKNRNPNVISAKTKALKATFPGAAFIPLTVTQVVQKIDGLFATPEDDDDVEMAPVLPVSASRKRHTTRARSPSSERSTKRTRRDPAGAASSATARRLPSYTSNSATRTRCRKRAPASSPRRDQKRARYDTRLAPPVNSVPASSDKTKPSEVVLFITCPVDLKPILDLLQTRLPGVPVFLAVYTGGYNMNTSVFGAQPMKATLAALAEQYPHVSLLNISGPDVFQRQAKEVKEEERKLRGNVWDESGVRNMGPLLREMAREGCLSAHERELLRSFNVQLLRPDKLCRDYDQSSLDFKDKASLESGWQAILGAVERGAPDGELSQLMEAFRARFFQCFANLSLEFRLGEGEEYGAWARRVTKSMDEQRLKGTPKHFLVSSVLRSVIDAPSADVAMGVVGKALLGMLPELCTKVEKGRWHFDQRFPRFQPEENGRDFRVRVYCDPQVLKNVFADFVRNQNQN